MKELELAAAMSWRQGDNMSETSARPQEAPMADDDRAPRADCSTPDGWWWRYLMRPLLFIFRPEAAHRLVIRLLIPQQFLFDLAAVLLEREDVQRAIKDVETKCAAPKETKT